MRLMEQAVNGRAAVKLDGLRHLADTVTQKVRDALQAVFDGVFVQKQHLCCTGHAAVAVQKEHAGGV